MHLIADSGSTKTDWLLLDRGHLAMQFNTRGFNPYYYNKAGLYELLTSALPPELDVRQIQELSYYGSGCSTADNCQLVQEALQSVFHHARISVQHDMLGAARALLGNTPGIACILGTGSNSCYYDGQKIVQQIPSLGYILGDDGSGVQIGKEVLKAILYKQAPETMIAEFDQTYKLSQEQILKSIYRNDKAARFLAGFAQFASRHKEVPYFHALVSQVFDRFICIHLLQYPLGPQVHVSFTGSVAWHFQDILFERLEKANIPAGKVLHSPIEGLLAFHSPKRKKNELLP